MILIKSEFWILDFGFWILDFGLNKKLDVELHLFYNQKM